MIPSVTGREASLARCVESYERHTEDPNIIVIRDEETCGLAWRKGMEQARTPYLHLTCDDIELMSGDWLGRCVERVDVRQLPCPIVHRPDGSIESCGGEREAPARLISHLQDDGTEVDFTVLPFLTNELAREIGMVESHYMSDVWVSARGRMLGWPTVVTHGYEVAHHYEQTKRRHSAALRKQDRAIFAQEIARYA